MCWNATGSSLLLHNYQGWRQRTLRFSPCWLIIPSSSGFPPNRPPSWRTGKYTLVRITSSSRGRFNCLIAFPRIISDFPFEYTWIDFSVECHSRVTGTYIRSIKCRDTVIISVAVSRWILMRGKGYTYAYLICLIASSSPRTHSAQLGSPYDIAPRMIFETLRPEFPRRTVE